MKRKIMFYTMTLKKGGAENTIVNIANEFINKYDITIVTNVKCKSEYILDSRVKHICLDKDNKQNESLLKKIITKLSPKRTNYLKKVIISEKPDLVFSFLPEPSIRLLKLKRYFKIPLLVSVRNHPEHEFIHLKKIRDFYYKKATTVIVQDKSYIKYFSDDVKKNMNVIPNFLTEEFTRYESSIEKRNKIVTVTRLEPQKNLQLLIRAFSLLDHKFDDYELYIYGIGSEYEKLKKLIDKYDLNKRVILAGRVKSIPDEISDAVLFVLPSNYEGMPNVLLEAMSLSIPVITTYSTEVIDSIITSDENGIIVPVGDVLALRDAMDKVLSNKELQNKLRTNASKVREIYNKDNIIKLWKEIIERYL